MGMIGKEVARKASAPGVDPVEPDADDVGGAGDGDMKASCEAAAGELKNALATGTDADVVDAFKKLSDMCVDY